VVVVDSGDLLVEQDGIPVSVRPSAELKARLVARIYQYIGCDAVNVGERDLGLGVQVLKELEKTFHLPLISANLTNPDNQPLFKRYIIKQVNGKSIGIFGILGDTAEILSAVKRATGGEVVVQDAITSAESVVKELEGKVDFIIALTHEGVGRDWVMARRVPGIDVIVGGHDKQKIAEPRQVGKVRIVQAGEKGQYLGLLKTPLKADARADAKNTLIPLSPSIQDDARVQSMINEYIKQLADLHGSDQETSAAPHRAVFCASCHQRQFRAWEVTSHARAYDSLVKRGRQFDPECLRCHTTRFEEPEGFSVNRQSKEHVAVQCESCHGHVEDHGRNVTQAAHRKSGREACITCHSPDRSPAFEKEYGRYLQKVRH
jgi:Cytochrome c554 and c-prime